MTEVEPWPYQLLSSVFAYQSHEPTGLSSPTAPPEAQSGCFQEAGLPEILKKLRMLLMRAI